MDEKARWTRLSLRIAGRVQGVGFRYRALHEAQGLGLVGWVRNLVDGTVELVAEGPHAQLERMLVWCHRGPEYSEVDRVDDTWSVATGEFDRFFIRHG